MTYIGTFTATRDGFEGHLHTLTLDTRLALVPAEPSETENAPDYRIMGGDNDAAYEVGAGWKRVGDKAGDYIAVLIDDPARQKGVNGAPWYRANRSSRRIGACVSAESERAISRSADARSFDRFCSTCARGLAALRHSRALDLCRDPH